MPGEAAARSSRYFLKLALLAMAGLFACAAAARDFAIRYHERIELLNPASAERVSFVAYGRQFDLLLESNAGIVAMSHSASRALKPTLNLYRGRLAGHADSWVRLSETDDRLSGAIWDGTELWLIDTQERLADYLLTTDATHASDNVIFRLSEVSGALGDAIGEMSLELAAGANTTMPSIAAASFGPQPGRVLDIGLVATTDFAEDHGANARDVLLETFNVIEGIFITQVGVQLRAAEISILDSTPADLQEKDPQTLLNNFADYKVRTAELLPLGLAHLFVARDLDDLNPPTRTVGMANLGVLCDSRFGVGITQATHATILNAVIAAHEFGHNFGAPHDAQEGSVCEAESSNFIMAAKISGSTRFSQCSIEQMQPEISSAGCMRDIPPTDLQLTVSSPPPQQVHERDTVRFSVVLSNNSNTHVAGVELNATSDTLSRLALNASAIEGGYCDGTRTLNCVWPWFPAGASVILDMSAVAETPGDGVVDISVDSLHELDASDNALHFDINVQPLAELVSLLTPANAALHPGESRRFEAAVFNSGDARATGVLVYIEADAALELHGNELNNCTLNNAGDASVFSCPIGTLTASQSLSFGFSARVPADIDLAEIADDPTAGIRVYASSDQTSLNDADAGAQSVITIGESISDLSVTIDGPNLISLGEESVWEIVVENHGPDLAESVRIFDNDSSRMLPSEAVHIESNIGTCSMNGSNTEFDCSVPTLGVGESARITLTASATQQGQFFWIEATAESAAPDSDRGNNQTSLLIAANEELATSEPDNTATDSSETDDDSGGGSTGPAMLILLAALTIVRRRYIWSLYQP